MALVFFSLTADAASLLQEQISSHILVKTSPSGLILNTKQLDGGVLPATISPFLSTTPQLRL